MCRLMPSKIQGHFANCNAKSISVVKPIEIGNSTKSLVFQYLGEFNVLKFEIFKPMSEYKKVVFIEKILPSNV